MTGELVERPSARGVETVDSARLNRAAWDRWSDTYQAKHGQLLAGSNAQAWGLWRAAESRLQVLGDVHGLDVAELGCGAAHWSRALADRAGSVTAIDNSTMQLRHAAKVVHGTPVALVQAAAEQMPFADATFDVAFSDYGALSWADPARSVPEAARVLRPGGVLAFCTASPFFFVALDAERKELKQEFQHPYFGMRQRVIDGCAVDYHITFSEWVTLFVSCGFMIERLVEVVPPDDAVTTFSDRPLDWARKWPAEMIWKVRKVSP